jgi:hypothetical protein
MQAVHIAALATLASGLLAGCDVQKSDVASSRPESTPAYTSVAANTAAPQADDPPASGPVAVAPFDSVELKGGGHVVLRYGAVQRVTLLQGSTQYTRLEIEDRGKLVIHTCNNDCPMHYDLEVEIVTPHIGGVAIEGGGRIETAAGFPAQGAITAAVEGGGNINIDTIDAKAGTAAIDGGGKILLRADERLTAAVNGGGAIRYAGNPNVTSAINGGGSVRPEGG